MSIDNNSAERAVKQFVIGRKNWLFSQTANGAHASATLYSIVDIAKVNGLIPFDYIIACLNELCQPEPDIDSLLPWNFKNQVWLPRRLRKDKYFDDQNKYKKGWFPSRN